MYVCRFCLQHNVESNWEHLFACILWQLFAFDKVKGLLNSIEGKPGFLASLPVSPIAGSCAGISSTLVMYPLELLKTRLTIQVRIEVPLSCLQRYVFKLIPSY
jgi:hypothetical protein